MNIFGEATIMTSDLTTSTIYGPSQNFREWLVHLAEGIYQRPSNDMEYYLFNQQTTPLKKITMRRVTKLQKSYVKKKTSYTFGSCTGLKHCKKLSKAK